MTEQRSPETAGSRGFAALGYPPHPSTAKTSSGVWRVVWVVVITTVLAMIGLCVAPSEPAAEQHRRSLEVEVLRRSI